MTGNEYQKAALRTASITGGKMPSLLVEILLERGYPAEKLMLLNGVLGMSGEAGECSDIVKSTYFRGIIWTRLILPRNWETLPGIWLLQPIQSGTAWMKFSK